MDFPMTRIKTVPGKSISYGVSSTGSVDGSRFIFWWLLLIRYMPETIIVITIIAANMMAISLRIGKVGLFSEVSEYKLSKFLCRCICPEVSELLLNLILYLVIVLIFCRILQISLVVYLVIYIISFLLCSH